jgi:hypothetical protein
VECPEVDRARQGIATEAAALLLRFGFDTLGPHGVADVRSAVVRTSDGVHSVVDFEV